MEPINEILKENVTKLNHTLLPPGFHGPSARKVQQRLSNEIDNLGELSAVAQELPKKITSGEKLSKSLQHVLYLLKDSNANGGKGEVIGMLKVGPKHLYLYENEHVREVEPLCVLDFFILGDRQRHGYGKILFDHMLKDMQVTPQELPIDGPSPKMELFLKKNYGLVGLVRQSVNFAVTPAFFSSTKKIEGINRPKLTSPAVETQIGRFAASRPHSTIGEIIHGANGSQDNFFTYNDKNAMDWH